MEQVPHLMIVEPTTRQKHRRLTEIVRYASVSYSQEETKLQLKRIRSQAVDNMAELAEGFRQSVTRYTDAHFTFSRHAADAVGYISGVIGNTMTIAVGKSSIANELRPGLEKKGYSLIDTYYTQFSRDNKVRQPLNDPWQFPIVLGQSAWDTFDCSAEARQQTEGVQRWKDVVALVGVNAASAEDGSMFFVQHSANVSALLGQARTLFVVVGLEKIVANTRDAMFQAKCAGAFGMESILLDLAKNEANEAAIDPLAEVQETSDRRQLHVILLDNGRTDLAASQYRELLRCIGCRACLRSCSGYRYLRDFEYFPREYLWSLLMGYNSSIALCSHCSMCKAECPLEINLPKMMAKAKAEFCPRVARSRDSRVLLNVTGLAGLGSAFAPIVNQFSRAKWARWLMEKTVGIDRRRKLPTFHHRTFESWFRSRNA